MPRTLYAAHLTAGTILVVSLLPAHGGFAQESPTRERIFGGHHQGFQTSTRGVPAQEAFDTSALRVRHRLFRTEIVQGTESTPIGRIGFGTPPLEELFARSNRAAVSFDGFRKDHRRASWLTVLGGLELLGSLVARSQDREDWATALSVSGVVIEVAGMVFSTRADEHLSQAIWWYNASLPKRRAR